MSFKKLSASCGAYSPRTCANATIPSPRVRMIVGISSAMPVIITDNPATIEVAPALKATARAPIPAAIDVKPTPTNATPAPIARTETPNRAIAPARPISVGTKGVSSIPATPITANAPARATRPVATCSHDKLPSVTKTGARRDKAPAAIIRAAEPASVPFIRFKAIANSAKAPPIATSAVPILPQLIPPKLAIASARIFMAPATTTRPAPLATKLGGITRIAPATASRAPPIARRPDPIWPRFMLPKSLTAEASIFIEPAISTKDTPVESAPLAFPARLVNPAIAPSKTPTDTKPLTKDPISMLPNCLTA